MSKQYKLTDELPARDVEKMYLSIITKIKSLRNKVEQMPIAYFELSLDMGKIYPNKQFRLLINTPLSEIKKPSYNWKKLIYPAHLPELVNTFNECLQLKKSHRVMFSIVSKGGQIKKVIGCIKAISDIDGIHIAFTGNVQEEEDIKKLYNLIKTKDNGFKSWAE